MLVFEFKFVSSATVIARSSVLHCLFRLMDTLLLQGILNDTENLLSQILISNNFGLANLL